MTNTTIDSIWSEYRPMIDGLCAQFGKGNARYGAHAEDFRHEAYIWIRKGEDKLLAKFEELDGDPRFEKWLYRCIENEFRDYCVDIRDAAGGQPRLGAAWYSVNELKALLPSVLDKQKWHEPPQSEGKGAGIPAEGGNWIATLADVSRAFDQLRAEDRAMLWEYHILGTANKDLAKANGITEQSQSERHSTALQRLQKLLGGERPRKMRPDRPHDPFRGRRAISNRQALAITRNAYDGES